MRNRESKRKEGVRCRKLLLLVALAAVGLLVAPFVMGADSVPAKTCTTLNGFTIQTAGLDYETCGNAPCTQIIYKVSGGTPDHVATFVREEAGVPTTSGSSNISQLCAGDSVIGIVNQNLCHERIVRFNNQSDKATTFRLTFAGKRLLPLETSVVVRKGNSQGACAIVGFGPEALPENLACVPNCTQVNPEQTMTKTEIMKFKGCAVKFEYDISTGELISATFDADASDKPLCGAVSSNTCCYFNQEDVANLALTLTVPGGNISLGHGLFGDGFISSGTGSCTTRVIGGKIYTWGCPCPQ